MPSSCYLVGYDIGEPKRQAVIRYQVKNHTASGQKSAYECRLSPLAKRQLSDFALTKIERQDSFFIIKTMKTYWSKPAKDNASAAKLAASDYFYFG